MASTSVSVAYTQFITPKGELVQPLPDDLNRPEKLLYFYKRMHGLRAFDEKAIALQRIGQLGTFPAALGQEAIAVGVGAAMHPNDVLCPYYRDHGVLFERGVSPEEIFCYWGGDERGSDYQNNRQDFPMSIPIASQCLHAVGVSFALQYHKRSQAAVCLCGDGGTSKGDFYEAINLAGVWKLPVLFIVNNNQWAISVPRGAQTASGTLSQKSIAAGFDGYQVDGNDIVSVYYCVKQALQSLYRGEGPILLEMISYRLCDHTTADDAKRYVDENDLKQAWDKEPLKRLYRYLKHQNLWSDEQEKALKNDCQKSVQQAAEAYLSRSPQAPTALFDYLYKGLPKALAKQYGRLTSQRV